MLDRAYGAPGGQRCRLGLGGFGTYVGPEWDNSQESVASPTRQHRAKGLEYLSILVKLLRFNDKASVTLRTYLRDLCVGV